MIQSRPWIRWIGWRACAKQRI